MLVKNTYGTSVAFSTRQFGVVPKDEFSGSALQRKKPDNDKKPEKKKVVSTEKKEIKLRTLSRRSKQKIRKKITCFARCYKRLSFVTLTFLNKVSDDEAVMILRKFLNNYKSTS